MAKQSQTVTVATGADETYAKLKDAVAGLRYSVERFDDETRTAYLKSGVSAFSWGESITVSVAPAPDGGSVIELTSAPKLGANLMDMGRGKRELQQIADAITGAQEPAPAKAQQTVSVADEIRKLAQLRDEGILTEEEFAAKKKQLLGI